jgi:NADH dehydrogenase FAD-containing subunit
MPRRLVLAGGGHAHLFTLSRWRDFAVAGIDVVCIAPSQHLSYSGMGPGMLSGRYAPEALRFDIAAMLGASGGQGAALDLPGGMIPPGPLRRGEAGGAEFVRGVVTGVDTGERILTLADGREIAYDAVSFGLGSRVAMPFPVAQRPGMAVYPVKPIENLLTARRDIESRVEAGKAVRVLVAGGGAAGFEVAGNALALLASLGVAKPLVAVAARRGLLPDWPERARRMARASLVRRGARLLTATVVGVTDGRAALSNGATESCDVLLAATGTGPPELFAQCGLSTTPDGGLTVNAFLQSPFFPEIFGGGDCIHFGPKPLPRAGVYAVRQGPVLRANLLAALAGRKLTPFRQTGTNYLALLNCGDGRAILRKGPVVFEGAWCMALKDWIDRKFMRSFPHPLPPA